MDERQLIDEHSWVSGFLAATALFARQYNRYEQLRDEMLMAINQVEELPGCQDVHGRSE